VLVLHCCQAAAQTTSHTLILHPGDAVGASSPNQQWTAAASVYVYFPPEAGNFLQPTLSADHDWLHLEARYNYEELDTGSLWLGYNLGGGRQVEWTFSPMLGAVFGKLSGVAPGYRGSLSWQKLELYSEGEYIIDTTDSSASYFYNWSELSLGLFDRLRIGLVTQHTHVYQSDRQIQRGVLAGLSFQRVDLTGYLFNPDQSPTFVIALSVNW
jgi:hypothetical protein